MENIQIRSARFEDLEQLNSLMFELHDFHHQSCPTEIKTAEEIEEEKSIARYLDDPECMVFVAVQPQTNQVIGFVTGHFCELISVISKPIQMGSVDELYVKPDFRNQSIANRLMTRMETTFEEYGVEKVFIEVWHFNSNAVQFYEKIGFTHQIHWLCKPLK